MPNFARFIEAKIKQAARGSAPLEKPASGRVPPGQHVVENFPVLDLGTRPAIRPQEWTLELCGRVEQPQTLDWQAFQSLPRVERTADIHCVTRWTRLDVPWGGVAARAVVELVRPLPDAGFVTLHCYDGYTTNIPLDVLMRDDALLADNVDGKPLSKEHGGPVRLVVPALYFWKSAKWIRAIEFHAEDRPGFWETRGYHNQADPWQEQRYERRR